MKKTVRNLTLRSETIVDLTKVYGGIDDSAYASCTTSQGSQQCSAIYHCSNPCGSSPQLCGGVGSGSC